MLNQAHNSIYFLAAALCLIVLTACAAPPAAAPVEPAYEIVAQGAATSGGSAAPITQAISGDAALQSPPAGLPPDVVASLQDAAQEDPAALYVVIYTGVKPGGGYTASVDAMHLAGAASNQTLVVTYSETAPQGAGTTALTYPYVIARVLSPAVAPPNVQFVHKP
jgi:hypothetical protein